MDFRYDSFGFDEILDTFSKGTRIKCAVTVLPRPQKKVAVWELPRFLEIAQEGLDLVSSLAARLFKDKWGAHLVSGQ